MAAAYEVVVYSDLYKAGVTEDGEDYTAEVFLVMVEFADGTRVRHNHYFPGCKVDHGCEENDGMVSFEDVRVEAEAKANRLARRVTLALGTPGITLDMAHWTSISSRYGS